MKKFFYLFLLTLAIGMTSCGDDEPDVDCTSTNFANTINALINDLNAAVTTYNNDPSSANCQALKDAANDYLDGVESFDDCADIDQTQFNDQLDQAREAVNTINC